MADSAWAPSLTSSLATTEEVPRHSALVRVTHWITTLCFVALLVSGIELVISHPRFYWGEAGNVGTPALFKIPIPASRATVPTGYNYVLPDQNGWSRYLHFQAAWAVVLTGLLYVMVSLLNGHFRNHGFQSYNVLQRLVYLAVIFVLFPLIVWTGLAMSPAFASAIPEAVAIFGGQQSARTLHFFITLALVAFLMIHIAMVWRAGFKTRVGAMITGRVANEKEHA